MKHVFSILLIISVLVACERDHSPNTSDIAAAEDLVGIGMTDEERALMLEDIRVQREAYEQLRRAGLPNDAPPALRFDPGFEVQDKDGTPRWSKAPAEVSADQEYAFLSVTELGALLRAGRVTSVELTEYFLQRIREHDDVLHAVITVTGDLAYEQARRADAELAQGIDRGPLQGIPYGLKDIVAVPGYPTTWGATPFRDQVLDETATVALRMQEAGAVLIAKTAVGALAWGDVWFGGKTRTPWKPDEGAHGSSAGSAAGVAAGFFPIGVGTETWGSIISPAARNGVIGLRPTFGRVSRHGVMSLAWSMDKVGALCRFVEDCGMLLDAIRGPDGRDSTVRAAGFAYDSTQDSDVLRWGYLAEDFDRDYEAADADDAILATLARNGVDLHGVALPDLPVQHMSFILSVEAAAAFDEFTRSGLDDTLVRQKRFAWPNVFRAARFIPAVEYLQANRLRTRLVEETETMFEDVDVVLAPCFAGDQLLATNLTGHPGMIVPTGFSDAGLPEGICIIGRPYMEAELLLAARKLARITRFHRERPALGAHRIQGVRATTHASTRSIPVD